MECLMCSFKIMSTPEDLLFFKILAAFLISSKVIGIFISSFSLSSKFRLIFEVSVS